MTFRNAGRHPWLSDKGDNTMNNPDLVAIQILDLPGANGGCACSDLSLTPEYAAMLQQKVAELRAALVESFPGQANLEYTDLRQDTAAKNSELGQLLVTKKYPTPLVVIAGQPKFAGSILVQKILKEVGRVVTSQESKGDQQ
jgi:Fe-S cluster biogenesis protein NfuA